MIDINKETELTIPLYRPAIYRIHGEQIIAPSTQRRRNISILFKAKFSDMSFHVQINPYKVVLC